MDDGFFSAQVFFESCRNVKVFDWGDENPTGHGGALFVQRSGLGRLRA